MILRRAPDDNMAAVYSYSVILGQGWGRHGWRSSSAPSFNVRTVVISHMTLVPASHLVQPLHSGFYLFFFKSLTPYYYSTCCLYLPSLVSVVLPIKRKSNTSQKAFVCILWWLGTTMKPTINSEGPVQASQGTPEAYQRWVLMPRACRLHGMLALSMGPAWSVGICLLNNEE